MSEVTLRNADGAEMTQPGEVEEYFVARGWTVVDVAGESARAAELLAAAAEAEAKRAAEETPAEGAEEVAVVGLTRKAR